jgi:hypothetical protein
LGNIITPDEWKAFQQLPAKIQLKAATYSAGSVDY